MVGFISHNQTTNNKLDHNNQHSTHKLDAFDADSFLDFDAVDSFFQEDPAALEADTFRFGDFHNLMDNSNLETHAKEENLDSKVKEEHMGSEIDGNCVHSIQNEMGRINLAGVSGPVYDVGDVVLGDTFEENKVINGLNTGISCSDSNPRDDKNVKQSDSGSDSESSSSTSSSSSSSGGSSCNNNDEDDREEESNQEVEKEKDSVSRGIKKVGEVPKTDSGSEDLPHETDEEEEEGELVESSDVELDDNNEDEQSAGPVRSKGELEVLPPVPPVNVSLEPHHQMLPVGVVSSIVGKQVIVEGVEKHNPLNEGSILWITERRSPLGLVDEIFGPVKHPYYVVRYNSENELPAGITEGALISCVVEFANHVLNDKNLYSKGYDASAEADEELSDEFEFSDDEKEAEYRRKKAISKRGMNEITTGRKKKNKKVFKDRHGKWNNRENAGPKTMFGAHAIASNQTQPRVSHDGGSLSSVAGGSGFFHCPPMPQVSPPMPQISNLFQPFGNAMPFQLPQNSVIPGGFPVNSMPWPAQNRFQLPNPQAFDPSCASLPTAALPGAQLFAGPLNSALFMGQSCFNQNGSGMQVQPNLLGINTASIGDHGISSGPPLQHNYGLQSFMGVAGQSLDGSGMNYQAPPDQFRMNAMNMGSHGMNFSGPPLQHNHRLPSPVRADTEAPQRFHMGTPSGRGRNPRHRGGGRFAGGRPQQQ